MREVCTFRASILRVLTTLAATSLALPVWGQVSGGQNTAPNGATARSGSEPYIAEYEVSTVKTLANGSTITQEFTEVRAVDAQGRTMTAITTIPASSDETATTKVSVSDPVARTNARWDSRTSLATVVKRPSHEPGRASCWAITPENVSTDSATDGQSSGKALQIAGPPTGLTPGTPTVSKPGQVETTIEHLGTQTIQGFEAHGSRVTQTTPAGAAGNTKPLVSTRESWQVNVHGIGLTVREVDDDPENGKRITELVKFSPDQPDPASLHPPEGYEISTQEMHQVPCQQPAPTSQ